MLVKISLRQFTGNRHRVPIASPTVSGQLIAFSLLAQGTFFKALITGGANRPTALTGNLYSLPPADALISFITQ